VNAVERVEHVAGAFGPGAAALPVAVRMASEADLSGLAPEFGTKEMLRISGAIVLESGMLVALGCPVCLSNAIAAAGLLVVLTPVVAVSDAHERAEAHRVEAELEARDVTARTRDALARLRPAPAAGPGAELVVVGYGFAKTEREGACFFLAAQLRANGVEQELLLGPRRRSDDAPAPHCASRSALAAHEGALTARVVDETAEILAGLVATRLEEAP